MVLHWDDVLDMTGWSRRTVWRKVASGDFPRPVRVGQKSSVWLRVEVDAWFAAKLAARDAA